MRIKIKYYNIMSIWLCLILIPLNIYGDYIKKIWSFSPMLINSITTISLVILYLVNKNRWSISKNILVFMGGNILISLIHMCQGYKVISEFKHISYIVLFVVVTSFANEKTFNLLKKVILFISFIAFIDALINIPQLVYSNMRLFNIRNYTMLDKTLYTIIFPLSVVILINGLSKYTSKYCKILAVIYSLSLISIMALVFESKMGLLALMVVALGEMIFLHNKFTKKIFRILIIMSVLIIFYYLFNINKIPDYIIALLGFFDTSVKRVNAVYYSTYNVRFEIISIVFKILEKNPLLGCGFDNYYQYVTQNNLQVLSLGISDVESAVFEMLAEGGIVYFTLNAWILLILFKRLIKNTKTTPEYLGIFLCLMCLIWGNDYMNIIYWVILGILWNVSGRYNETDVNAYNVKNY